MRDYYNFYEGILKDIENGLKDEIRTETLADKYSISRTHLQRLFKYEFRQNIGSYIRSRKLAASIAELKNTDLNILDIALEYGFEHEQSYIRAFKKELGITPGNLRKTNKMITEIPSLLLDNNRKVNQNNFRYELWQDKQIGSNSMLLKGDGLLKCKWNNTNYINFRTGKYFDETKTYSQFGPINIDYGFTHSSKCDPWRGIYGWTVDPLIVFFIVESCDQNNYFVNNLPNDIVNIDGEKYYLYERDIIVNRPSIKENQPFKEYWSIRADKRSKGIVPVSEHFKTWEKMGMKLGKLFEISVAIVGYQNSGDAEIYRNYITIGDTTIGSKN
jgi:AraC-like DNA-binding protein